MASEQRAGVDGLNAKIIILLGCLPTWFPYCKTISSFFFSFLIYSLTQSILHT